MPERTNRDPAPGFVAFDTLLAEALREQTRRELAALPGPRQLAQLYPDTSAWDKRLKKALAARRRAAARAARAARKTAPPRRRLPLRRLAAIAAVFVLLMAGTLAASAEVRYAVRCALLQWGDAELRLTYETEGQPAPADLRLPAGFTDHYVPDGFVLSEGNSVTAENYIFHQYINEKNDQVYTVYCCVVQPEGQVITYDNEHTTYETIILDGVEVTLGSSTNKDGRISYYLFWTDNDIHHTVQGDIDLDELKKVAADIF